MLTKISRTIAIALAAGALSVLAQSPVPPVSAAEIRFNEIWLFPAGLSARSRQGKIVVPDRDATVSAYGGQMRLYDVHIARMIAMSHQFYCFEPYGAGIEKVMTWEYWADNGKINMGTFNLPCTKVEQAVNTYGLGRTQSITILNLVDLRQSAPRREVVNLRTLDISSDAETTNFLRFVQTIKPQR